MELGLSQNGTVRGFVTRRERSLMRRTYNHSDGSLFLLRGAQPFELLDGRCVAVCGSIWAHEQQMWQRSGFKRQLEASAHPTPLSPAGA